MTERTFLVRSSLTLLALTLLATILWLWRPQNSSVQLIDEATIRAGIPATVARLLNEQGTLRALSPAAITPVYVALRHQGAVVAADWFDGADAQGAVIRGIEQLIARNEEKSSSIDTIELCLPHSAQQLSLVDGTQTLDNSHRGTLGLRLRHGSLETRVCPTEALARNISFGEVETKFRMEARLDPARYARETQAWSFSAHQFLIRLGESPSLVPMFRGNTIVRMDEVSGDNVRQLADRLGHWLRTQVQPDGRMIYMYLPSEQRESQDNNMIRQFMATVCLVRMLRERPDDTELRELARRNLRYNLERFFVQEGDLGLIRYGDARLGAMALAALAIVESPFRAEFARYEKALRKTTEYMQKPDGSFYSFFGSESTRNQNFYPGETLLLWATLYEEQRDPALWERIDKAFRYYRQWHREQRNPAFIPWHTQAYVKLLQLVDYPEMRDFVFEMNDWLLDVQQWESADYPDQLGRFYDPNRPFGPPHASSTAVYLEGLIDAYRLAVAHGDSPRQIMYRRAILGGLRALMQLQFVDEIDMYYVPVAQRDRVWGGLRTTVYDNRIRVDNVQHALMGLQRILPTFDAGNLWELEPSQATAPRADIR